MTEKERKMNNIHNAIMELYGDNTRVVITVTKECMAVETNDRINIDGYSMQRINGEWVEKR